MYLNNIFFSVSQKPWSQFTFPWFMPFIPCRCCTAGFLIINYYYYLKCLWATLYNSSLMYFIGLFEFFPPTTATKCLELKQYDLIIIGRTWYLFFWWYHFTFFCNLYYLPIKIWTWIFTDPKFLNIVHHSSTNTWLIWTLAFAKQLVSRLCSVIHTLILFVICYETKWFLGAYKWHGYFCVSTYRHA